MQPLDTPPKYRYDLDLDSDIAPAHVVRMVGKNKRVLEIGCASGSQTKPLNQQFGCEVTGIEISPEAAEEARPYCKRLLVGDIERMDLNTELGDSRFDVITFGDVLEHLRDPKGILEKVRRFIDVDGYVLISVPNIAHASVVFELMNGRFDYRPIGLLDDTHIHFFTKRTLVRMVEDASYLVAELNRIEIRPESTEFKTTATTQKQIDALNFVLQNNEESLTYQFVLKAVPVPVEQSVSMATAYAVAERIRDLEDKVEANNVHVHRLESQIKWLESRPPIKAARWVAKLFKALSFKF